MSALKRISLLQGKHISRRRQHVLRSRKHLDILHELQQKYVFVCFLVGER